MRKDIFSFQYRIHITPHNSHNSRSPIHIRILGAVQDILDFFRIKLKNDAKYFINY